ncbi:protein disulfide isomerase family protein [Metarhizium robertsii]|uniref:Protein disulfide-isomerase n=2 Tax=Metarhizium robertsii TaxID=568076 RepID=A0A014PPV9_9HYPO|nr:protein disulfide isomerase family protein [Metarhizium robertsii]
MRSQFSAMTLLACQALAWSHSSAKELKSLLTKRDNTLVAFVVPDHEASKTLLPEWTTLQDKIATKSIDCIVSQDLCAEFDVVSFPAIRLYRGDQPMIRYRGPRTASSLMSFFARQQQPAYTKLSKNQIERFTTTDDFVVIAHLHEDDEELLSRFSTTAEAYRDRYSFGYSTDVAQQDASRLTCYNNIDNLEHSEAELDQSGVIERFLETCKELLIPQLTRRTELKYRRPGKSLVYYFTGEESDRDLYVKRMKPLARTYHEYLRFVTVDSTEYADMSRGMGLELERGLVVENTHGGQLFPYRGSGGIGIGEVENFITAISQGAVQPWTGHRDDSAKDTGGWSKHNVRDEL